MKHTFIQAPPRKIPWTVTVPVLMEGPLSLFGWVFFIFGTLVFSLFFQVGGGSEKLLFLGTPVSTRARVSDTLPTDSSVNGLTVWEILYTYDAPGGPYEGRAYAETEIPGLGDNLGIEYLEENPGLSRPLEYRAGAVPEIFLLIPLLFPLIGLIILVVNLVKGIKSLEILKIGETAMGVLKHQESTGTRINGRPLMRYWFEFRALGQTWEAKGETLGRELLDDEEELLFYDPKNPQHAVMADSLPGRPGVDDQGHYVGHLPSALAALIPPALFFLLHYLLQTYIIQELL